MDFSKEFLFCFQFFNEMLDLQWYVRFHSHSTNVIIMLEQVMDVIIKL